MYSSFIISINGVNIIFTLNVYVEYVKLLHKIFAKCIMSILKFIQVILLYFLKLLQKKFIIIYNIIILHIFINYIY
jgi:hypothetical protein